MSVSVHKKLYFGYKHTDYKVLLQDYAKAMGTTLADGDILMFPPEYGKGYFRALKLPLGLQAMIMDVTYNRDVYITRLSSKEKFFILRFDEMKGRKAVTIKFDKEYNDEIFSNHTAAVLTLASTEYGYILQKGSVVKGVNIIISKQCLQHCLGIKIADSMIKQYLQIQSAHINLQTFDTEYRKILNEIMLEEEQNNPLKDVYIQNRVMLLIEKFFIRFIENLKKIPPTSAAEKAEYLMLQAAEAKLVGDLSKEPPALSVLAKEANMSVTKFATRFKALYGLSPFEYYQKNRMHYARNLLVTGKYSIKEVGLRLNFKNLSNFSVAFKKEFGFLPSEINVG